MLDPNLSTEGREYEAVFGEVSTLLTNLCQITWWRVINLIMGSVKEEEWSLDWSLFLLLMTMGNKELSLKWTENIVSGTSNIKVRSKILIIEENLLSKWNRIAYSQCHCWSEGAGVQWWPRGWSFCCYACNKDEDRHPNYYVRMSLTFKLECWRQSWSQRNFVGN